MAHYLNRKFKSAKDIHIFHDLRVQDSDGEVAQIDHLALHRRGFILIESKSVTSRIEVNRLGEWSRQWNGKKEGMASPVHQVRRQAELLRNFLHENSEEIRHKRLFGKVQFGFGACPFDVLVAVSDGGIIHREKEVPEVFKADQIPDEVQAIINRHDRGGTLGLSLKDGVEKFSDEEMDRLVEFLLDNHTPAFSQDATSSKISSKETKSSTTPLPSGPPSCRHCQSIRLKVDYGRYGYYFKCKSCEGNTPIDAVCESCGKKGRTRKQKEEFYKECKECDSSFHFHTNV